ncbi:GNAT family N-acetyltransferase [Bacillus sp. F19]|nr:GNAT family N-acetyltransferase [Bacillus sp. F19]
MNTLDGYETEAAKGCLEISKNNRMVRTIFASADKQNKQSLEILKKLDSPLRNEVILSPHKRLNKTPFFYVAAWFQQKPKC